METLVRTRHKPATPAAKTGISQRENTTLYTTTSVFGGYAPRYLDPKTSRWLSADPAMGEYVPIAPNSDDARRHNQNLPGMGGVFNYVNLHTYHYSANNPVVYVDPTGKIIIAITAQYTMQDQTWSNTPIPLDGSTMALGGCAITLAGNVAYSHNNATAVTPGTIVGINANFNANGLLWGDSLSGVAGLSVGNRIDVANGAAFETAFNQFNESATEYFMGIKVNYNGVATNDHWVGASAIETLSDGNRYVRISRTSTNDSFTSGAGTAREGQGWRNENGNIYVPLDNVQAYRVFTRTGIDE